MTTLGEKAGGTSTDVFSDRLYNSRKAWVFLTKLNAFESLILAIRAFLTGQR
ncbi:MAG: hypothetical protein F6K00_30315 [Leptolyngbya sp. SIOISBB]|nr:hypothetical protein [Leptolyngbya sp. SIOISBB]